MMSDRFRNWFKSSFSTDGSGCVEVCLDERGTVAVRDSKLGDDSEILVFSDRAWRDFIEGVRTGEF